MDGALIASIVSSIASVGSLIVATVATRNAWRSKQDARAANERAERSATAAEKSARAAEAYADINKELFEAGKSRFLVERDPSVPNLGLSMVMATGGYLIHDGTHNVYDVTLSSNVNDMRSPLLPLAIMSPGTRMPIYHVTKTDSFDTRFTVHFSTSKGGPVQTVELVF